jgi:ABC-2 type transport system ATP-binding protein
MSVKVNQLSKHYDAQKAVDNISFEAKKGEVLGFLGPNGAGKTTTMKIITCFIPQTEGKAEVCGYDVVENPIEVRRRIGYLPEHNPLYKDMYVKEYLDFAASTHKIANKKSRIDDMIDLTGLNQEAHKPIGALSKGYRQRVGLAQAMIHNPDVLILDEPTSGLDPNQLIEIRQLIKNLGREKTLIFSTHIMQEVQAICDRVVIINRGSIVADAPIENLQDLVKGENIVVAAFSSSVSVGQLEKIKGATKVKSLGNHRYEIRSALDKDLRENIFRFAVDNHLVMLELYKSSSSVEDIFQQLTSVK